MLENSLQRSSTVTSVHFATPARLHELFAQDNKSPFGFPQSSPEVLDTILSRDISPEKMFTLVTLPRFCAQIPGVKSPFISTKLPTRLVGQVVFSVLSYCLSKTFTPLTTAEIWFLLQLTATQTCNQVSCMGSLVTSVSALKRRVSPTCKRFSHLSSLRAQFYCRGTRPAGSRILIPDFSGRDFLIFLSRDFIEIFWHFLGF